MKYKLAAALFMAVGLLLVSGPLLAHHSDSVYDQEHYVTIEGTVTQFEFTNPHVLIQIDANKGDAEHWTALGGPPNRMIRVGWSAQTFKPGEKLTIVGFQYSDRKVMLFQKIVRSNGEEVALPDTVTDFSNRQGKKP